MKWAELSEKSIPQELLEDMNLQKEACNRIIASKDELITEFTEELRRKDEEYVKALRRQATDIDLLLQRMQSQTKSLQSAYASEIAEIENAFVQERIENLENNRNEIEGLFEKRRGMEVAHLETRQQRIEDNHSELDAMRVQAQEDFNILKIRLETEIQGLEQQLEEMRAQYQLNTEKLDYNYKVLSERDQENTATINQHRKRIARLQDVLSNLMAKYHKTDKHYRQQNMDLTEEYKRITEQFKDLQNKFRHFEITDNKKYREMWDMNEQLVDELVQRVLQADKIITEDMLGWQWVPPDDRYFEQGGSGEGGAAGTGSGAAGEDADGAATLQQSQSRTEGVGGSSSPSQQGAAAAFESQASKETIKRVLQLIRDEAGFMVDDKVRTILEPLEADEQNLVQVDAILKILGVDRAETVEKLVSYFLKSGVQQEQLEGGADIDTMLIEPNDAIAALREFYEDHQQELSVLATSQKKENDKADAAREDKIRNDERLFWERMGNIIPDDTFRAWGALEREMQRYNKLLSERCDLIDETNALLHQNDELRALLGQYLNAGINDDLAVPPTDIIQM
eukprot:TRINITY_DN2917_c0_g1_i2.p1 TRINITY_DN2917_c0_g1~~TRINITY_DN2917_c0_g1_i2.p1  ORF type:complete len:569 (+),score=175.16 TRINITY_DN2917_c0_g1_i2:731-2437(+)